MTRYSRLPRPTVMDEVARRVLDRFAENSITVASAPRTSPFTSPRGAARPDLNWSG